MSNAYKITDQFAPYCLTFQVVQWADIFTRQVYRGEANTLQERSIRPIGQ
jgi:hypothetical protein